jgi:hypothetical protein
LKKASKQALLFLKKKKQKDFCSWGPWRKYRLSPQEQKFFAPLFFKKAASCLL